MQMTSEEICRHYVQAADRKKDITILAELNETDEASIRAVLIDGGVLPPDPPKRGRRPRADKPAEPLTCGLVDRHGMPLRAGDTVAADKFFVYAVRYGSHNVNPDNCAPAYQVGWYLEIMWAYPGFADSVGHTEPLYDIDGTAARYPAHCANTADGLYNLKLEVCCRPPEGEEDA